MSESPSLAHISRRHTHQHLCDQIFFTSHAYYDIACRIGDEQTIIEKSIHRLLHQVITLETLPPNPQITCITIPRRLFPLEKRTAHILHGQVWRWSHLRSSLYRLTLELQPTEFCFSGRQMEICLNPYHYKQKNLDIYLIMKENDLILESRSIPWASINYYEKNKKVGGTYLCHDSSVHVSCLGETTNRNCFNLDQITNTKGRDFEVTNARRQIGSGIILHCVNGQIFVELLSDSDLFVNSKFYNRLKGYSNGTICKLSPFRCKLMRLMRDDDFHQMLKFEVLKGSGAVYSFAKICTIRVSFVQGWGDGLPITETPCWIEIRFLRQLKWLEKTLSQMRAHYKLHF